jgi:uncharacterized membrane protein HdeD (DUF308 family)
MFTFAPSLSRGQAALRGALATILGIVFVIWPNITIGTAVILFAVYCLADAIMQFTNVFGGHEGGGQRFLRVLLATADVAAAGVAIVWPGVTAQVLVVVIGVWAIFGGIAELAAAFSFGSGALGLMGGLSVAAGVVLVVWPGIGAVSLALVVGIYLGAYGITLLAAAASAPDEGRVGNPFAAT